MLSNIQSQFVLSCYLTFLNIENNIITNIFMTIQYLVVVAAEAVAVVVTVYFQQQHKTKYIMINHNTIQHNFVD